MSTEIRRLAQLSNTFKLFESTQNNKAILFFKEMLKDEQQDVNSPEVIEYLIATIREFQQNPEVTEQWIENISMEYYHATAIGQQYGDTDTTDDIRQTLMDMFGLEFSEE